MRTFLKGFLWLVWFTIGVLAQQRELVVPQTALVTMRDGIRLATDIYLPTNSSPPYPVILMRTPYNKANTGGAGSNGARLGYAIVVQDTRGRFGSEGENLPFNLDGPDGFDTVQWITEQGWCNGKIATFGGSALGITQLQLAGTAPAGLVAQHITVAGPNLYGDVVYTGGAFRKALVEDWLRLSQFSPRALELWTGHYQYDRFWRDRDVSSRYKHVNTAAVHIGGYFDIFAQGTIDAFLGYQTRGGPKARGHQKLLMGPWTHGVLTEKAGDLVFPNSQRPPNDVHDHVRWWDYHLKGKSNVVSEWPAVTYYVMGDASDTSAPGNVWRTADRWPPVAARKVRWYLHEDQTLSMEKPTTGGSFTYRYDPKQPVPTIGGYQLSIPAGPRDQRAIEGRADVLVFTSESLPEPIEITGQVKARLVISSDVPDTDFLVRLCDVYPDGRSFNISEGIIRARYRRSFKEESFLRAGKLYSLEVPLWTTSIIINKSHRIRAHITSSSAPAYDPNPNTKEPLRWSGRTAIARNTIHLSSRYASYLELPIVP